MENTQPLGRWHTRCAHTGRPCHPPRDPHRHTCGGRRLGSPPRLPAALRESSACLHREGAALTGLLRGRRQPVSWSRQRGLHGARGAVNGAVTVVAWCPWGTGSRAPSDNELCRRSRPSHTGIGLTCNLCLSTRCRRCAHASLPSRGCGVGLGTGQIRVFGGWGTFWEPFSNIFSLLLLDSVDVKPAALLGSQTFPLVCTQVCRSCLHCGLSQAYL